MEWRTFANEGDTRGNAADPNRVGGPTNPLLKDGLTTSIQEGAKGGGALASALQQGGAQAEAPKAPTAGARPARAAAAAKQARSLQPDRVRRPRAASSKKRRWTDPSVWSTKGPKGPLISYARLP